MCPALGEPVARDLGVDALAGDAGQPLGEGRGEDAAQVVPQLPGVETGESYITLTACSPLYSLAERIVAYGVFDNFQPRAEGPPPALTDPPPPPAAPSV